MSKIQVLIVDDIAETRENIRKLLQFESDVEVIGVARTGQEAITLAGELMPDVILMDINMPDMDGIAATEIIRKDHPWVQIVILSVQGDPNYMRRAMLAGARDFLTKPPTIDDLIAAIRRAGVMAKEEREKSAAIPAHQGATNATGSGSLSAGTLGNGKVITVFSPKGGVGCSTLAANLAVTLQNDDSQVAIVDANLQFGNASVFFNQQAKNHVGDLAPRVDDLDPDVVRDVMIVHEDTNVHILAAPPKPEYAEDVAPSDFGKLIEYLKSMYQYVIIDTPSTLTDHLIAAIDVSNLVVLVSTQDIPSIANVRAFLDLSHALGLHSDSILFVLNRFDKRINITAERLGDSLKRDVVAVIPLDSRTVVPSINRGIPFMSDSRAKAQPSGRAILSLAEAVRQKIAELDELEI